MGAPPVPAGAVHDTTAVVSPGSALTLVGCPGAVTSSVVRTAVLADDQALRLSLSGHS